MRFINLSCRCLASLLVVLFLSTTIVVGQDKTVSVYQDEREISDRNSVTLVPGFFVPAGKTVRIFTGLRFTEPFAFSGTASTDQNYVSSKVFKVRGVNEYNLNDARQSSEVNQSIQYFDGLGRPLQTVTVQGSPTFKDIIQPIIYDAFGREVKKYLPYAAQSGTNGAYRSDGLSSQVAFYNSPPAGVSAIANSAFSETVFEPSPLNRVLEQGAPGASWQIGAGHTSKIAYGTNNIAMNSVSSGNNAVRLWTAVLVTTSGQEHVRRLVLSTANSGLYAAGELFLTTYKDENWVDADGKMGTTEEYKDKQGQVVLKRTFNLKGSVSEVLSTYYVYDDYGNLSFVLPPGAGGDATTVSADNLWNYCYQYRYDGRQRLIEKKVPGKGWEQLIYNPLDQVAFTQDSVQRTESKRSFVKYDALGRVLMTGVESGHGGVNTPRSSVQTIVNGQNVFWESPSTASGNLEGYTTLTVPNHAPNIEVQVVNYYDTYLNIPGIPENQSAHFSSMTKTLLTASKVRVLGTTNFLWTINYYDDEGQLVEVYQQHYLGGQANAANYDRIHNTYNFAGELTASHRAHHVGSTTTTVATRYEYDHMGRKKATMESINGALEIALNKLDYNEIGQLYKKSIHSSDGSNFLLQNQFTYNERGWMKKSSSPRFSYELGYNEGTAAQYKWQYCKTVLGNQWSEYQYVYVFV